MTYDFDVAIIGSGPAGITCALALHEKGLSVAIFDKDIFPRDKICGDAIPGASFKAIESIHKTWGEKMKAYAKKMEITASTSYFENSKPISYNWKSFSYNCKRIDFDNFLFQLVKEETNTHIFEHKRLQKISTQNDHVLCEFQDGSTIKVGMVIGCDGANSLVKRQVIKQEEQDSIVAIRAYYKNIEGIKKGENEFHIIKGLSGYFWIFPLQDNWANVGFGVFKKNNKNENKPKDLRLILEEITNSASFKNRFKNAELIGNINGFGLPIFTKKRTISGNRFMLCGDAASLIDPLQGHGIDKAIWSGILAAKQIENCFHENNFSADFIKNYDKMVHDKFAKELSRNYFVMRTLLRFSFLNTLIFKLSPPQKITNWIVHKLKI